MERGTGLVIPEDERKQSGVTGWRISKEIFQQAMELDPVDRAKFLDSACGPDLSMRRELESLLLSHDEMDAFLVDPLFTPAPATGGMPTRFGVYRVVEEIGEGGMGIVYRAVRDDEHFTRTVAIKSIKPGLDTREILRRFQTERQILANLNHPNIAKLLDAGTDESGRPYFVMEHIDGKRIDEYCDANQLTVRDRLTLFLRVCSAVQYAHQNFVVHRDLKPSNILVTQEGEPRLLDFGIAKLLGDESGHTQTFRPMTPEYASPEQVLGNPITTGSDVYSLGILLYQLLTGKHPYGLPSNTPSKAANAIANFEAVPMSAAVYSSRESEKTRDCAAVAAARNTTPTRLQRQLRGDLDNIVAMAMRTDLQARYQSVEQFAADISRHFAGLPVSARSETALYRAARFVRRHKTGTVLVTLVFLALSGGIAATAWQARIAQQERAKAEVHLQEVRQLANSLIFELHDSIQSLPGATPARQLLIQRAVEYLGKVAPTSEGNAGIQRDLAVAWRRISEVQGSPYVASLGQTQQAMDSAHKGLAILKKLLAEHPNARDLQTESANAHANLGDLLWLQGDWTGSLAEYRSALENWQQIAKADPLDAAAVREISVNRISVADALKETGDLAGALSNYQEGLAIRERLLAADSRSRRARRDIAVARIKVAGVLLSLGDNDGALSYLEAALPVFERLAEEDPHNAQAASDLQFILRDGLGDAMVRSGKPAAALPLYERAMAGARTTLGADPASAYARRNLMISFVKLGEARLAMHRPADAEQAWIRALEQAQRLRKLDPGNTQAAGDLAAVQIGLGDALLAQGRIRQALESYLDALATRSDLASQQPKSTPAIEAVAEALVRVGDAHLKAGSVEQAVECYKQASAKRVALIAHDSLNMELRAQLAISCRKTGAALGEFARGTAARSEARSWYQQSIDHWAEFRKHAGLSTSQQHEFEEATRGLTRASER